jgi:hypothetical protein
MEQTPIDKIAGMNEAIPLRRCEYPEYARPTAGIIGQQKTVHTRTKRVSNLLHFSQASSTAEADMLKKLRCVGVE